jgi:AcrR family transcriptional regulator
MSAASEPPSTGPATRPAVGLRERKKLRTRAAIQKEALRLFQEQGYEETTIEQIAAAVDISPSTFFNYFPSKEDVIIYDQYDPVILSMIKSRPRGESLSAAVGHALDAMARFMEADREVVLARAKLALEVPEIRARYWEEIEKARLLISAVINDRTGRNPDDFEVRVVSMVTVVAAGEASMEWVRRGGRGEMMDLVRRAFDLIDLGARLDALESSTRNPSH